MNAAMLHRGPDDRYWAPQQPRDWPRREAEEDGRVPAAMRRAGARGLSSLRDGRALRLADVLAPVSAAERHLDWVTAGRRHARATLYGPALAEAVDHCAIARGVRDASDPGSDGSLVTAFMRMDQTSWLQDDILPKGDRAGMLVSLELRTPYLHRELAEFAASVDGSRVYDEGRFDRGVARRRIERHISGASDESGVLWPLLTLGLWLDARRIS